VNAPRDARGLRAKLAVLDLSAAAEKRLGKPVIAINAATWWHVLGSIGIDDATWGKGSRLERFRCAA
jgi:maleate isomerase